MSNLKLTHTTDLIHFFSDFTMPILYSVVARGTTVLAKYASCPGNFTEVTDQILTKIPPENGKLSLSHGSYLFHYIWEDRIIYMCITDDVSFCHLYLVQWFAKY